MATDTGGPATGQALMIYQNAPKTVAVTVSDPNGVYSGGGATADWRVGPRPTNGVSPTQVSVPSVFAHKTSGFAVSYPSAGTVQVTFTILPSDVAALTPSAYPLYQHEVWMTLGGVAQPVAVGPLTYVGTVSGETGWPG